MSVFASALAHRFPDAKLRTDGDVIHAVVRHGDGWFSTRSRTSPFAEIFVALRPTDGFELEVRWGDRFRDPEVGDLEFDGAFGLATNDASLMRAWLDEPARVALLDSVYEYETAAALDTGLPFPPGRRTWTYELHDAELAATKGTSELDPARFLVALETACAVAARPHRWAQEYAVLARALDAAASSVVEIGGAPVITTTRRATSIAVRVVRRGAGIERLRTWISCARLGLDADVFSLVRDDLLRDAVPDLPAGRRASCDVPGYALRSTAKPPRAIDDVTRRLLGVARPSAFIVDSTRVDVWLDGAPMEREPLDVAIELAAHWAVERGGEHGPYR